jgi:hypothetical protein
VKKPRPRDAHVSHTFAYEEDHLFRQLDHDEALAANMSRDHHFVGQPYETVTLRVAKVI